MPSPERALELARAGASRVSSPNDPDRDDMVQEAALRILKFSERHGDKPDRYFAQVGRNRIRSAVEHRTWTGMATSTGTPVDPLRRAHGSVDVLLESTEGDSGSSWTEPLTVGEPGYEQAEWTAAYAEHIEIAIARLPAEDQRVVALGVYREGKSARESLPGKTGKAADSTWRRARTQLRQELAWIAREGAA